MIKINFLGTADAIPSASRNHTAILLTYKGENILVDCGEGTQRQFRKARLNPGKITRILITHWHTDHILGLPGLLKTLESGGYNKTLFIYGPRRTKILMNALLHLFAFKKSYRIEVKEVTGKFFETPEFYLEAKAMTHSVPTNAYSFVKKGQLRIDKNKLARSKLPSGPLLQKLKQGKNINYKGKKFLAKNLTYREQGKKVSFILDTSMNKKAHIFVKNSDLLICEASFASDLKHKAREHKHLTAEEAAQIAKKSKSRRLILTHVSQRYDKNRKKILNEAKRIFKNTSIAKDLDVLMV